LFCDLKLTSGRNSTATMLGITISVVNFPDNKACPTMRNHSVARPSFASHRSVSSVSMRSLTCWSARRRIPQYQSLWDRRTGFSDKYPHQLKFSPSNHFPPTRHQRRVEIIVLTITVEIIRPPTVDSANHADHKRGYRLIRP
jgi:hypothetical protein